MQHQRHPLKQRGVNGGGGGYDSVRALNSISYSDSIEDEKHDGDDDGDDDDSVVDSAVDGEEYSDALSGGYGDDDDDEGDLDSEAREDYNSGASELVTTVRSVQFTP